MTTPIADCTNQVMSFYRHLDERDYGALTALLAADATWYRQGKVLRGPGETLAALQQRSPTMRIAHLITNLVADRFDTDLCVMRGYMLVVRHDSGQAPSGPAPLTGIESIRTVHIKLVRNGGQWLISHMRNDDIAFAAVDQQGM